MNENRVIKALKKDWMRHKWKYFLMIPVLAFYIIFRYKPMYGIQIAFKDYSPVKGIAESEWVGFKYFIDFFKDPYFFRLIRNTLRISILRLLFMSPAPIILALLLNEVRVGWFKRGIQTITYMPHFIATVVVCGLIKAYTQSNGVINDIIVFFGGERINLLMEKEYFIPIYIISGIWSSIGWSSIVYLAALSGIDQEQYEAAKIDGAGRLRQLLYITLPGLLPTIVMLFILDVGSMLSVGSAKIILLYQPLTYEVADVISTYVYRRGVIEGDYSFSTAVDLFNSLINLFLLRTANSVSRKLGQSTLF